MWFRLPFSPLFVALLQWLELCPSQLHPRSYPYVKAFGLVCQYLRVSPSKDLFFSIFYVRREADNEDGRKWVTLCQSRKLFVDFEEGPPDFKGRFFLVRLRTEVALSNVLKMIERPHSKGDVACTRIPRFNFFWYLDHFGYEPKVYKCKYFRLSSQDKLGYNEIRCFVESFHRVIVMDVDGNPKIDSLGNPITVPRVIDTRSLVFSLSPTEILGSNLIYSFFSYVFCYCLSAYVSCWFLQEICRTCAQKCVHFLLRRVRKSPVRTPATVVGGPAESEQLKFYFQ